MSPVRQGPPYSNFYSDEVDDRDLLEPEPPPSRSWYQRVRGVAMDITPLRRSRDYRLLWAGSGISFLGSQLTFVAIPYQVFKITNSTLAVGITALFELIPLLFLSLVGGAIADAVDRRRLLLVTDALFALTSLILVTHAVLDHGNVIVLYVLAASGAALYAIGAPALRSATPLLLEKKHLPAAAALSGSVHSLGGIIGPMIAGTLIAVVGLPLTYAIDALTFLISMMCVYRCRPIPPMDDADPVSLRSVFDGLRFLKGRKVIQGSFIVDINAMVFGMPEALFPAFALGRYGGGPAVLGVLYAAPAAGALIASATSGWTGKIRRQGLVVYIAVLGWGVSLIGFGLSSSVVLGVIFLSMAGAADDISAIFRSAILQASTPHHMIGRLSGLELAVVASGPSLGNLEAGVVASFTTLGTAVVSGGVLCCLGVGLMAWRLPQFARYDAHNPSP